MTLKYFATIRMLVAIVVKRYNTYVDLELTVRYVKGMLVLYG